MTPKMPTQKIRGEARELPTHTQSSSVRIIPAQTRESERRKLSFCAWKMTGNFEAHPHDSRLTPCAIIILYIGRRGGGAARKTGRAKFILHGTRNPGTGTIPQGLWQTHSLATMKKKGGMEEKRLSFQAPLVDTSQAVTSESTIPYRRRPFKGRRKLATRSKWPCNARLRE